MTNRIVITFGFTAVFASGFFMMETANAGDKPCKAATFQFDKVKAACTAGGENAAKELMKEAVKKGKAAGDAEMDCKSCHEDTKDFTKVKDGSVDKLKPLL